MTARSEGEDAAPVASPCIGTCKLDAARVCIGCRRTIDEIAGWAAMSDTERRRVLERLRRAAGIE